MSVVQSPAWIDYIIAEQPSDSAETTTIRQSLHASETDKTEKTKKSLHQNTWILSSRQGFVCSSIAAAKWQTLNKRIDRTAQWLAAVC